MQVTLDAAHIGHGSRADDQAGHAKQATDRQLTCWKRMFERTDGGFDGGAKVVIGAMTGPAAAMAL